MALAVSSGRFSSPCIAEAFYPQFVRCPTGASLPFASRGSTSVDETGKPMLPLYDSMFRVAAHAGWLRSDRRLRRGRAGDFPFFGNGFGSPPPPPKSTAILKNRLPAKIRTRFTIVRYAGVFTPIYINPLFSVVR